MGESSAPRMIPEGVEMDFYRDLLRILSEVEERTFVFMNN
jgi:hypothetical protein